MRRILLQSQITLDEIRSPKQRTAREIQFPNWSNGREILGLMRPKKATKLMGCEPKHWRCCCILYLPVALFARQL
jgi:hypothetical protein